MKGCKDEILERRPQRQLQVWRFGRRSTPKTIFRWLEANSATRGSIHLRQNQRRYKALAEPTRPRLEGLINSPATGSCPQGLRSRTRGTRPGEAGRASRVG